MSVSKQSLTGLLNTQLNREQFSAINQLNDKTIYHFVGIQFAQGVNARQFIFFNFSVSEICKFKTIDFLKMSLLKSLILRHLITNP